MKFRSTTKRDVSGEPRVFNAGVNDKLSVYKIEPSGSRNGTGNRGPAFNSIIVIDGEGRPVVQNKRSPTVKRETAHGVRARVFVRTRTGNMEPFGLTESARSGGERTCNRGAACIVVLRRKRDVTVFGNGKATRTRAGVVNGRGKRTAFGKRQRLLVVDMNVGERVVDPELRVVGSDRQTIVVLSRGNLFSARGFIDRLRCRAGFGRTVEEHAVEVPDGLARIDEDFQARVIGKKLRFKNVSGETAVRTRSSEVDHDVGARRKRQGTVKNELGLSCAVTKPKATFKDELRSGTDRKTVERVDGLVARSDLDDCAVFERNVRRGEMLRILVSKVSARTAFIRTAHGHRQTRKIQRAGKGVSIPVGGFKAEALTGSATGNRNDTGARKSVVKPDIARSLRESKTGTGGIKRNHARTENVVNVRVRRCRELRGVFDHDRSVKAAVGTRNDDIGILSRITLGTHMKRAGTQKRVVESRRGSEVKDKIAAIFQSEGSRAKTVRIMNRHRVSVSEDESSRESRIGSDNVRGTGLTGKTDVEETVAGERARSRRGDGSHSRFVSTEINNAARVHGKRFRLTERIVLSQRHRAILHIRRAGVVIDVLCARMIRIADLHSAVKGHSTTLVTVAVGDPHGEHIVAGGRRGNDVTFSIRTFI